jgi:tetratricopeptide (TPR) repeat protein
VTAGQLGAALLLAAVTGITAAAQGPRSQGSCRMPADTLAARLDAAWDAYRAGKLDAARPAFRAVLRRCPDNASALVGVGYIALRANDLAAAKASFERALVTQPRNYDALTGIGIVAYRAGDLATSRRSFERALETVPGDSLSRWYIERLPVELSRVTLPPRTRPAATTIAARTGRRVLEVPDGNGSWRPFWVKALNVGAALPGKHPSQFPPDDGTYRRWIDLAARMNANTLRVYTIHPPHFYRELREWNLAHADRPLRLIHGVWTELPPGKKEERYDDPGFKGAFLAEMRRVVDLVHGNAVIAERPGHADGVYTADVSPWTLAYITGREWEPYSVVAYAAKHPRLTAFRGEYLTLEGGNAVDVWLAEVSEAMIAYEMERYNAQRPMAYTNWPTLDPLHHPTESTLAQEDSIRRTRREVVPEPPKEFDNDAIGLDATLMRATPRFRAGFFASFHAYPYYPDFMAYDPRYARARSPEGPSTYFGYLSALVRHFGDMPVVISEYGVPSSRGNAHLQPQGWHHGGHSEARQAEINARLTRDIHAAGAAGAGLFATIDEWFKKNWLVIDFERPAERKRLWLNPLDAEQSYGVLAMRPGVKDSGIVIDGRPEDWHGRLPWYEARGEAASLPAALRLRALRVAHDEAYMYLRLDVGAIDWSRGRYTIGIDTHGAGLGDARLPYTGSPSPVGLEFVVDLRGPSNSRVLVDSPYNLYRRGQIRGSSPPATQQMYNRPFRSVANADGRYDTLFVVTNRRRIGRDGTVYPERGYDRNLLLHARQSETTLADWYADTASGTIEMRIPWGMLHVLDPSSRQVLRGMNGDAPRGTPAGVATDGFRFVVESYDPSAPTSGRGDQLPRGSGLPALWTWPTWETPRWYEEVKPLFDAMRETFGKLP